MSFVNDVINSVENDPTDPAIVAANAAKPAAAALPEELAPEEEVELDENGQPKAAAKTDDDTPFPKKAINALSRRDRTIGRQRAQLEQMAQKLAQYESGTPQPPANEQQPKTTPQGKPAKAADAEPSEADYENFGEYLKDLARWTARQGLADESQKNQETQQTTQQKQWVANREAQIQTQAVEHAKVIPDFQEVLNEHADVLDYMPENIAAIFYQLDDAAMAFYNLAKADKLEALLSMTPAQAAYTIGQAMNNAPAKDPGLGQANNLAQPPAKKLTNAPAPLAANKGTGASGKPVEDMSADDLLKLVRKR